MTKRIIGTVGWRVANALSGTRMIAPERIWATFEPHHSGKGQEYVRADLYDALQVECAEWRKSNRETFDALCAMRNDINEYLPLPSLESDLLQGPELSIFAATVAQAVVNAMMKKRENEE